MSTPKYLQQLTRANTSARRHPAPLPVAASTPVEDKVLSQKERKRLEFIHNTVISHLPRAVIDEVFFYIYTTEEIDRLSVSRVVHPTTGNGTGEVNDRAMGTADSETACSTCGQTTFFCNGHFGSIELKQPVLYPRDEVRRIIVAVLNSVCIYCSDLLLPKKDILDDPEINTLSGYERLKAIADKSKNFMCSKDTCSNKTIQPKFRSGKNKVDKDISYYYKANKNVKHALPLTLPVDKLEEGFSLESILINLSPATLDILGFQNGSTPYNFIMKRLIVIPPRFRHSRVPTAGGITDDPITKAYVNIVSFNNNIEAGKTKDTKRTAYANLVKEINILFHGSTGNGDRPENTGIYQRLNDKYMGAMRGASLGKPVMFSGRSVIIPAPHLEFGEVAIPEAMAPFLTKPVYATAANREALQKQFVDGGIVMITPKEGQYAGQLLRVGDNLRSTAVVEIGDRVERWAQDGDFITLNRQPTLHKQSVMAARIKLWPYRAIGLHMAVTTDYNADFDGDEMNVHMVQSDEASNELEEILNMKRCIVSAQQNKVEIGIVYNGLLASVRLSSSTITAQEVILYYFPRLIATAQGYNVSLFERAFAQGVGPNDMNEVSGRILLSAALMPGYTYRKDDVVILDGIIISGIIKKNHIGLEHNTIIQDVLIKYGYEEASRVITDLYFILNQWLNDHVISVGYEACVPTPEIEKKKNEIMQELLLDLKALGANPADPNRESKIEATIDDRYAKLSNIISKDVPPTNQIKTIIQSGAKGNNQNLTQISAAVGQQRVQGSRPPLTLNNGTRYTPYYIAGDSSPEARGFISNSYIQGLTVAQFFAQQVNSAEDLVAVATRTPDSGALSRSLTRAMENIQIRLDMSVKDSNTRISSFIYGDDSLDAHRMILVESAGRTINSFCEPNSIADMVNAEFGYLDATAGAEREVSQNLTTIEAELDFNEGSISDNE